MRRIGAILLKDSIIYFTSPMQWLFFLVLPVVFSVILGLAGAGMEEANPVNLGIVDRDDTAVSRDFIDLLAETGAFKISSMTEKEDAASAFRSGNISGYLVIPADFTETMTRGGGPALTFYGSGTQNTVVQIIDFVLSSSSLANNTAKITAEKLGLGTGSNLYTRIREQTQSAVLNASVTIVPVAEVQEVSTTASLQVIGQLITWALINMLVASAYLVHERERGTYQRLLIAPIHGQTFLIGAGTFQFLSGLFQMALLIIFGSLVMGIPWTRSIPGLFIVLIPFAASAVSLGLLLAAFAKTSSQADSLSVLFGMGMALLGGCWFPLMLFPETARTVAHILPTTWTLEALTDLVLRGKPAVDVIPHGAVLLGFAAVFYSAAWIKFSRSRRA